MQFDVLAIRILSKMYHYGYVGGRHTSVESLKRSFASHEKGMVDKTIKKLVKLGLITHHPTSYGRQYSLNQNRLKEIEDIIENNL
jgi:predicted transcriptional regulator